MDKNNLINEVKQNLYNLLKISVEYTSLYISEFPIGVNSEAQFLKWQTTILKIMQEIKNKEIE